MRKGLSFVLLVLTFLKTGTSKSRISVLQRLEDGDLTVTCNLLSEDKVTQINWEMVIGQNRSKVGILHPLHGTHILPDHKGNVELQSSASYHSTSLTVIKVDTGNSSQHCCLFITFPSGNLEACADLNSMKAVSEAPEAHIHLVTDGRWKVVTAVIVVSVLMLIGVHFLRRRYCNGRRHVFQVEQVFLSDPQTDSMESSSELPQSSPKKESSEAFDPSKLYAKIKIDYYYGRLWKAYESKTRGKGPQPKIYHLLEGQPTEQRDNEEPQQG
ncbi:hypothetical protein COCON_G00045310 [Conger conger]|uniref:Transmembrane protein PVRIG immunoglobulin-like domain-containing protein n=1 Tax=Conger conger TaxID=82655 RepID=A0A9Q1I394_CONCO|nr:immunoglobulin domain-containing protein [Conger conger]KAJ8282012.1 hypothetical protein COCON_G00045310 [Conger conger]